MKEVKIRWVLTTLQRKRVRSRPKSKMAAFDAALLCPLRETTPALRPVRNRSEPFNAFRRLLGAVRVETSLSTSALRFFRFAALYSPPVDTDTL